MRRRRAVALLVESSNAYARGLLEGIVAWVREHDPWSIYFPEQGRGAPPPGWLSRWKGDGIIARIENEPIARAVARTRLPVVDVSAGRHLPSVPWVETDDAAIARLAADHFLERGFRSLAWCGDPRFNWSRWRRGHFEKAARAADCDFRAYESPSAAGEHERLIAWVRKLPRPVGVLACYDIKAQQLLDACRDLDVAVPEQVAVLGVDNDRLLCTLSSPPLSSVIPNTRRTGFVAAELLARMMSGRKAAARAHLIPPTGIETRQSTEILALEDPGVAAAVRFIREHACEGITVPDVLRAVPFSRRTLEGRFRKVMGRTPHDEILRLKIERVKQLLAETDLKLSEVARKTGFPHVEYMSVAFKRLAGQPPSEFRLDRRG